MLSLVNGQGQTLYLMFIAACLTVGLLSTLLGGFSSIGFAVGAVALVDLPIVMGLVAFLIDEWPPMLHAGFILFGSAVPIIFILNIYVSDAIKGSSSTAFIHESFGWICLFLFTAQVILAVSRFVQIRGRNGV
jgi:hypothetical protein